MVSIETDFHSFDEDYEIKFGRQNYHTYDCLSSTKAEEVLYHVCASSEVDD